MFLGEIYITDNRKILTALFFPQIFLRGNVQQVLNGHLHFTSLTFTQK